MRAMTGLLFGAVLLALQPPVLAQEIAPKIVLQTVASEAEVAAWSPDDRYLVTARASTRELQVWNVASGDIVNRIALPSHGDYVDFAAMEVGADGRTVRIEAGVIEPEGACRPALTTIDLATAKVTTAVSTALLDPCTPEDFDRTAAKKPASHKAGWRLLDASQTGFDNPEPTIAAPGLYAFDAHNALIHSFAKPKPLSFDAAAMAPDGRRLALVDSDPASGKSRIEVFDLPTSQRGAGLSRDAEYGSVEWIDDHRILLTSGHDGLRRFETPDIPSPSQNNPPPDLIVDAVSGAVLREVPQRCFTASLGGDRLVGADLADCRGEEHSTDPPLQVFENGSWRPFAAIARAGRHIDRLTVSPDRQTIVLALDRPGGADGNILRLIKATDGSTIATADFAGRDQINAIYAEDDTTLLIAAGDRRWVWAQGAAKPTRIVLPPRSPVAGDMGILAGDAQQLFHSNPVSDQITRIDRASGAQLPSLDANGVFAVGFLPGGKLLWTASETEGIGLWDRHDWHRLATTYLLPDRHFVTVAPDGRYDTDLGADATEFRWLMADAPFQSLPAQTFMRDYFEPRLASKLLACSAADTCASALAKLPSLASLNRVLPQVTIPAIKPSKMPGLLEVTVNVREGIDLQAVNGKTHSGVYNVRLFRDGRLVMQHPDAVYAEQEERMATWQKAMANRTAFDPLPSHGALQISERDPEGVEQAVRGNVDKWREWYAIPQATGDDDVSLYFNVEVPTAKGSETAVFSAYAFNADRVKSETVSRKDTRAAMTAAPRRAFVVTIGIDAYDDPSLKLSFAANDARLMAKRLSAIPGYEVHAINLTAPATPGVKPRKVTRDLLEFMFSTLSGGDARVGREYLAQQGFDGAALDTVHPDDIVIVTYSGHGYTDPQGSFFMLPSDARLVGADRVPDPASLISASNLAVYLGSIKAGEIALIIDACHSAASVDANNFKPGPMGDPGLGQLAFDKGIRILAASQSDDVALESDKLKQGLLTYALANEGLGENGGRADSDGDGRITLDEWLQYGAARLPSLSADLTAGRPIKGARGVALLDGIPAKAQVQQPALFDFTGQPSPVVLEAGQ